MQFNVDYSVVQYIENIVAIGSEGGTFGYGLDYSRGDNPSLVAFDFGALDMEDLTFIGESFTEGIKKILNVK